MYYKKLTKNTKLFAKQSFYVIIIFAKTMLEQM